jgi:membrane associated rhomboid family serine protease
VTYALVAINVLIFLYEFILPDRQLTEFLYQWGAIPAEISNRDQLITLFSSMFLHGGWLHLGGNMLFLYVFGDNIEDTMGHVRFLVFYLVCGLGAALAQVLFNPASQIPLIGASGAIAGVLGAYIVLFPHGRIRTLFFIGYFGFVRLIPAWVMLGYWLVLQFISGFMAFDVRAQDTGGVAFWAHIGGFLLGAALVFLFRDRSAVARQRAARTGNQDWQRVNLRQPR